MIKKREKSELRKILDKECKRDGKGRFKTMDVIKIAERLYKEQQFVISSLKKQLEMTSNTSNDSKQDTFYEK